MRKLVITKKLIPIAILVASVFLSMFVLSTPKPTSDEQRFSSSRALTYIKEISQEPHSIYDLAAHEKVRLYIKDTLTSYLGAENVIEQNYDTSTEDFSTEWKDYIYKITGKDAPGAIKNILGVIPGKSETGIMLVGHFDSGELYPSKNLGQSFGAADGGYALGTMLEIADLYKGRQLENTIYLLFTDANELGGYGADVMLQHEKDLMSRVGFVINMEVSGVSGPAYMFETSPNNRKVIEFYRKANLPVSYSLATTVYHEMDAMTDFTWFLYYQAANGINFATIGGHALVHTSRDNFQNVSATTLQHYGEQVTPLVDAFVTDPKYSDVHYFDANEDSVFFNLFSNVFVSYSETVAKILHFVVLILVITIAVFMVKKRGFPLWKLLMYAVGFLAALFITAFVYGYLMALFGQVPYALSFWHMNGSEWPTLLFMLAVAAVYIRYVLRLETVEKQQSFLLFGIIVQLVIALITGFVLPGVSFFFFVPALLGILALAASLQLIAIVKQAVYGATILISTLIVVPFLYSFFLAFSVNGTPVIVALLLFNMTVSLPVFKLQFDMFDISKEDQKDKIYQEANSQNSNTRAVLEQADVAARIKADYDRISGELRVLAEERRRQIAQARRKSLIRLVRIVLPVAVIISGILLLTYLVIIPATKYSKAQNLLVNEQYREAFALFSELGDYKDSEQTKERIKVNILQSAKVGGYGLFGSIRAGQ